MKVDVVMPKMGESLQEGTITQWMKKVGDKIERDEMILEISTDKVDTEVPAPQGGILTEILVEENETVEVGTKIAVIETDADAAATSSEPKEEPAEEPILEEESKQEEPAEEPQEVEEEVAEASGEGTEVVMPKMGESLQEGTIIKWLKQVGDKIERDEMILEISTDKVDTEVPSPTSGTLTEILAEEGDTVEVGSPIARIGSGSGGAKKAVKKSAPKAESAPAKKAESTPAPKQETKSNVEVPADGGTTEIPSRKGDKFFSPLVRKIAEENNVTLEELEQITGSGIEGRVSKKDILSYIDERGDSKPAAKTESAPKTETKSAPSAPSKPAAKPSSPAPQPAKAPNINFGDGDDIEEIPMDRVRQLIAEHMVYSKHTSAHVTSVAEADVTNIVNFRNKHKNAFQEREGFKLTFTPFFAKAALDALKEFPLMNVSVNAEEKKVLRYKRINLGIATALPNFNLIVPVIKNADILNLTGIARSVNDLAFRARNKQLSPDEIQGGTFTLTNVGTFGTLFGTPIINQPQTGIMGVGAIKKRPIVKEVEGNDLILIRHMMYVSITYDHRVIDGMLAGKWLASAVKSLESMNEETIQF